MLADPQPRPAGEDQGVEMVDRVESGVHRLGELGAEAAGAPPIRGEHLVCILFVPWLWGAGRWFVYWRAVTVRRAGPAGQDWSTSRPCQRKPRSRSARPSM